jgi:hypothetical protein
VEERTGWKTVREMNLALSRAPLGFMFVAAIVAPFAMLAVGFRLYYDSVIPEIAGLIFFGGVFAYLRPRYVWLWLVGIAIGIVLSERVFPATPPTEHIATYGMPVAGGLIDLVKLCAFPTVGSVFGLLFRQAVR